MKTPIQVCLCLLAIAAAALGAPPANDNFSAAPSFESEVFGTNVGATREGGEPAHADAPALHSVWWNYTATATGLLEIETMGSSFDTRLAVYTGINFNSMTLVAKNDDHSVDVPQSRVIFNATAGTVYHIAVDGFAGATGTIELVVLDATPPANDNFANAADLGSAESATATVRNAGATAEAGESTHAGQPPDASVWWQWTAPYNGEVQLDTVGSSVDTLLGVYVGTALNALTLVTDNDDGLGLGGKSKVTFAATAGTTYRIVVDAYNGMVGEITLNLVEVTATTPPLNDHFAAAIALPPGITATVTGTNAHATSEPDEPLHAAKSTASTVWWSWTPLAPGPVSLTTAGSAFDTVLAVYTGATLNALAPVAANDDISSSNTRSAVTFPAVAGTTYWIAVGGYKTLAGAISLSLSQAPPPPANDRFSNRTNLGNPASATAAGINIGATAEVTEPAHATQAAARSVWWQWTCPVDEFVTLTTAGSSFDTVLSVYTGSALTALVAVAANDDADPDAADPVRTSAVSFLATAGTTYAFAVDGKAGATGAISLALAPAPAPPNDHFADAATLTGVAVAFAGNNYDATAESGEAAHAGSTAAHSVWWQWTAPEDGIISLSTQGSAFDTRLAVYTAGEPDALNLVMANDNAPGSLQNWSLVRFRVHAGVTYHIALDGAGGSQGLFQLSLSASDLTEDNDAFADRINLGNAAAVNATGTNLGASTQAGEPAHRSLAAESSVWWQWTAPTTGWSAVSTNASDFEARLAVYTGSDLHALAAVPNVDSGGTELGGYNFHTTAGTTYVFAVDGVAGSQGQIALAIGAGAAPTPPANDNFSGRTMLVGLPPVTVATGSNIYASAETGEPAHGGQPAANSVWFQWTAPLTGRAVIDATAMTFPARFAVYTGSAVGALTPVAQSAALGDQVLEFEALAGTVYQLAIDDSGAFAAGGGMEFSIDYQTPPNDDFAAAIELGSDLPASASGFNTHATAEAGEPTHAGRPAVDSVWWHWTAAASGLVTIETSGSEADTLLAVYTGSEVGALTLVAANDDASDSTHASLVTFSAVAGTTYRIAVDGFEGLTGAIALTVRPGTAPQPPTNDHFATATDLGDDHPLAITGTNEHATAETDEPAHAGNPAQSSIWWQWTAPTNTMVTLDTLGSDKDTVLAVYTGTAVDALTLLASNDDATGGTVHSSLTFAAIAGTTYHIAVDGFGGKTGTIRLNLATNTPANDQFAHRASLGTASSVTVAGSNVGATAEIGEPAHAGVPAAHTVWWTWTAPANMVVALHTFGSEADTLLAVYTGTALNALTLIGSNDNVSSTDHNSRVVFSAIAGTAYQFVIGSAENGDMSDIDLALAPTTLVPAPVNDQFATATDLNSGSTATVFATNVAATVEPGEPDHAGSIAHASVWWQWTAPFDGTLAVDTLGSAIDTKLAIYTGDGITTLTGNGANDDAAVGVTQSAVAVPVTVGTTYWLAVDGFAGAEGSIALHLVFTPTGTAAAVAYATWASSVFPAEIPVAARQITADFDGDGVANGIEYLMALDPTSANGSHLTIRRTGSATILTYPRAAAVPPGFEILEGGTGTGPLPSWMALTADQMSTALIPGEPGQAAIVEVTVPDTAGFQFFRLCVGDAP